MEVRRILLALLFSCAHSSATQTRVVHVYHRVPCLTGVKIPDPPLERCEHCPEPRPDYTGPTFSCDDVSWEDCEKMRYDAWETYGERMFDFATRDLPDRCSSLDDDDRKL
jgi:hypothetical protein